MVPDSHGGLRCKDNTQCVVGRGGNRPTCPRDAATNRRIDRPVAGELRAEGPWFSDESIMSDLAEAAACLQHGSEGSAKLRGYLLGRLERSGINPDAGGGTWTGKGGRWGMAPLGGGHRRRRCPPPPPLGSAARRLPHGAR